MHTSCVKREGAIVEWSVITGHKPLALIHSETIDEEFLIQTQDRV